MQVKEHYFEPLAERRNLSDAPGGGRKSLAEEAARRIDAIRQKCPEDFDALAARLEGKPDQAPASRRRSVRRIH